MHAWEHHYTLRSIQSVNHPHSLKRIPSRSNKWLAIILGGASMLSSIALAEAGLQSFNTSWAGIMRPSVATAFLNLGPAETLPTISEFMASNNKTLLSASGDSHDWIEIHNPGTDPVDLGDLGMPILFQGDGAWA